MLSAGCVTTQDGRAVFRDLYLPPPTLASPTPRPGGGEEGAEPGGPVKPSKHKPPKDKSPKRVNAQTYCPAGQPTPHLANTKPHSCVPPLFFCIPPPLILSPSFPLSSLPSPYPPCFIFPFLLALPPMFAGNYVLSVEDVTEPPFLNQRADTCFVHVKVLPKQSN